MSLTSYDLKSLKKGLQDPSLIRKELNHKIVEPLFKDIIYRIKYRDATVYNYENPYSFQSQEGDTIYHSFFQELDVNSNNYKNFRTYLQMVEIAHYAECESILEIGAGISTTIWADFASQTGASITSIDADPSRLIDYIEGTRHQKRVNDYVNFIEGVSIEPNDLAQFYTSTPSEFGGIPVSTFADTLDHFTRSKGCSAKQIRVLSSETQKSDYCISDILINDGSLTFPSSYLTEQINDESIEGYASNLAESSNTGVLNNLVNTHDGWDMIWLDSGETSSMIEWEILKKKVNPGGLVALHDIFFPKSMKNFVVAASIVHDPDWDILLIDDSTKQGIFIAQRSSEGDL